MIKNKCRVNTSWLDKFSNQCVQYTSSSRRWSQLNSSVFANINQKFITSIRIKRTGKLDAQNLFQLRNHRDFAIRRGKVNLLHFILITRKRLYIKLSNTLQLQSQTIQQFFSLYIKIIYIVIALISFD